MFSVHLKSILGSKPSAKQSQVPIPPVPTREVPKASLLPGQAQESPMPLLSASPRRSVSEQPAKLVQSRLAQKTPVPTIESHKVSLAKSQALRDSLLSVRPEKECTQRQELKASAPQNESMKTSEVSSYGMPLNAPPRVPTLHARGPTNKHGDVVIRRNLMSFDW